VENLAMADLKTLPDKKEARQMAAKRSYNQVEDISDIVAEHAKGDESDRHLEVLGTELGIHLLNLGLVVVLNRLEGITCLVTSSIGDLP
jgi:hypothetical protein